MRVCDFSSQFEDKLSSTLDLICLLNTTPYTDVTRPTICPGSRLFKGMGVRPRSGAVLIMCCSTSVRSQCWSGFWAYHVNCEFMLTCSYLCCKVSLVSHTLGTPSKKMTVESFILLTMFVSLMFTQVVVASCKSCISSIPFNLLRTMALSCLGNASKRRFVLHVC